MMSGCGADSASKPANLAIFYPHTAIVHPERLFFLHVSPKFEMGFFFYATLAGILLLAITGLVLWFGRRRPYLIVGWFWYLGTLVPVIGLVQVGIQGMADRYTYVPSIGIFWMVVWGVCDVAAGWKHSLGVAEPGGGRAAGVPHPPRCKCRIGRTAKSCSPRRSRPFPTAISDISIGERTITASRPRSKSNTKPTKIPCPKGGGRGASREGKEALRGGNEARSGEAPLVGAGRRGLQGRPRDRSTI